jgi:hypothetical protein
MPPIRSKQKKPLSRSWQYCLYGAAALALIVALSVVLPQVDTSSERASSFNKPAHQGAGAQSGSRSSQEEQVIDGTYAHSLLVLLLFTDKALFSH